MDAPFERVMTVTVNPAVDCVFDVPGLKLGAHQIGHRRSRAPAGKGINVARVLARLGHPPIATGFVGIPEMPQFEDDLAAAGVQSQLLAVNGNTRENITLIDPEANVETHVRDVGFEVKTTDLERLMRKLNLLSHPGVLVVFAGSLPRGMAPEALCTLVELCLSRGAGVAVDAAGSLLREVRDLRLWAIKPNREELQALVQHPCDSDDAVSRAGHELNRTIENVLISCGESGGYLVAGGLGYLAQTDLDPDEVVSTVGCGDALLAGYIAARLDQHDPREAWRRAMAVAATAATDPLPGRVNPDKLQTLLPRAAVEPLRRA